MAVAVIPTEYQVSAWSERSDVAGPYTIAKGARVCRTNRDSLAGVPANIGKRIGDYSAENGEIRWYTPISAGCRTNEHHHGSQADGFGSQTGKSIAIGGDGGGRAVGDPGHVVGRARIAEIVGCGQTGCERVAGSDHRQFWEASDRLPSIIVCIDADEKVVQS